MPVVTALRPACAWPLCPALAAPGDRFCVCHKQRDAGDYRRIRGTVAQQGYDADWRAFRAWFLSNPDHMLCEDCGGATSTEVHHVKKLRDRPDLRLVESNCRALCKSCHSARTRRGE